MPTSRNFSSRIGASPRGSRDAGDNKFPRSSGRFARRALAQITIAPRVSERQKARYTSAGRDEKKGGRGRGATRPRRACERRLFLSLNCPVRGDRWHRRSAPRRREPPTSVVFCTLGATVLRRTADRAHVEALEACALSYRSVREEGGKNDGRQSGKRRDGQPAADPADV